MSMGNQDTAISEYQTSLQLDPGDQESRVSLTEALYHYDKFNEIPEGKHWSITQLFKLVF